MLTVNNLSVRFGKRILFEEVGIKFSEGNCYGIIGANGSGKSTFLKILSGEFSSSTGSFSIEKGKRMSVLKQDHNEHNEFSVTETVLRGNGLLFDIKQKMEDIYAKPDFSEKDGLVAGELSMKYEELDGWNAESQAGILLNSMGIATEYHTKKMSELSTQNKVKVLLAQALSGNPDILILDEPTNGLDTKTIVWLEDFLAGYPHMILVVSHDRHFLDTVCTHVVDIDYGKMNLYPGNYTFWYESSKLALAQKAQANKKSEEKRKELQEFIRRFSANASKSKQATSRKKLLDKIKLEDIRPSSRKYPGIIFTQQRDIGDQVLRVDDLSQKDDEGQLLFSNVHLTVNKGDKIAVLGQSSIHTTSFYETIMGHIPPQTGSVSWGVTTHKSYLPSNNDAFFQKKMSLVDWLRQYTEKEEERDEKFLRGFLGKMLFSGDEALKDCDILSGGEKVRCMLSKIMLKQGNVLVLDEPTDHLDLESISKLNESLDSFSGVILLSSRDITFTNTIANRIVELTPRGIIDRQTTYEEYINDPKMDALRKELLEG